MKIQFFANLGDDNARDLTQDIGARKAVLLSTPGAAPRTINAAHTLKTLRIPLAADNGNTATIFRIVDEFALRAKTLLEEREQEGALHDTPSAALQAKFRGLTNDIARRCGDFVTSERQKEVLSSQVMVAPNFFACLEDLTIPVLINLDIEPADSGRRGSYFVTLQDRGLKALDEVTKGHSGVVVGKPYATVHAFDYETAYEVGTHAAKIDELEGIATGLASFLNDRNYINSYTLNGRRIWLKEKQQVPRRYLRMLLVTLGLLDGFVNHRGALPRFHGLGVGAPIALPLLSLCAFGSPLLSVDATSPEKNASIGKVFVNDPAPLTIDLEKTAQALVEGRRTWDCPCPYCLALEREIPFDVKAARRYYNAHIAPRKIEQHDLKLKDGIGQFLSICWDTTSQPARKLIYHTRVNHSHWAMAGIAEGLRKRSASYTKLRHWVGAQCEAYKLTTLPVYAQQVDECLRMIDQLRPIK